MTRAYGVRVVEGDFGTTEGRRPRVVRGRPNWWVILAVSLALMALLVATAGNPSRAIKHPHASADAAASDSQHRSATQTKAAAGGARDGGGAGAATHGTTASGSPATTTPSTSPSPANSAAGGSNDTSFLSPSRQPSDSQTPATAPPNVTTTTAPAATTTTTAPAAAASSSPADRTQTQGILNPPGQRSNGFGFTGTGATTVSVVWSGSTYLTLEVSCPSGSQSVGGTSAMEATLPDASGSCLATVSEPASEDTALTYTITIEPAGG
jgi:hypothetical protein